MRILIVGGGLAGLALAIALRRQQAEVDIIERAPSWPTQGTGLYLIGLATRALQALGVGDAVIRNGFTIRKQSLFNHRGRLLAEANVETFWRSCGPCIGLPRVVLHEWLASKVTNARVRFGVTVTSLTQSDSEVTVRFSGNAQGSYDWVVGADGIRSTVRRLAFGSDATAYRGQMGWRFIAPLPASVTGWSAYLSRGRTFLFVPIDRDRAYCYADEVIAQPDSATHSRLDRLRELFEDFPPVVRQTVDALKSDEAVHYSPIEEVLQPDSVRGRVVLIGDAAHAMSPNMASGAAMAFEDALVLAELLARRLPAVDVVHQFFQRRVPRIEWVRAQTHRRDRMRNLNPLIRDIAMRMLWPRIYAANYQRLLDAP
jgi:2-polyprenyl-6-methoxyphenol hydroxylase-like FAD-dependent oxidoreductase